MGHYNLLILMLGNCLSIEMMAWLALHGCVCVSSFGTPAVRCRCHCRRRCFCFVSVQCVLGLCALSELTDGNARDKQDEQRDGGEGGAKLA